jgi:hypothetical protein
MIIAIPTTYAGEIIRLNQKYDDLIIQGTYEPFSYPWGAYGAIAVSVYLLISHQHSPRLRQARWIVWALNTLHAGYSIVQMRAIGAVCAYGVGLGMAWSILWVTNILLIHDAQLEFKRIERAGRFRDGRKSAEGGETVKSAESQSLEHGANGTNSADARKRMWPGNDLAVKGSPKNEASARHETRDQLTWQPFPFHSFRDRLDWVMDLMTTLRGTTWSFRIPSLPDYPSEVLDRLDSRPIPNHRKKKVYTYLKENALLRASMWNLIIGYIALDVLKTITLHDPYFRGLIDASAPTNFPWLLRSSPILLRSYRLIVVQLFIYWGLQTAFQLGPLFYVGVLGSKLIGPRGEFWAYPREWGSYWAVFERGLAGWWGEWWHQTFRSAFDESSKWVVRFYNLDPRSLLAKLLRVFVSFSISGLLHASASHTSIGATRPLRGPFMFFFLQPFGIVAQMTFSKGLKAAGISQRIPTAVSHITNFVFVHAWFYYTAPLLVDDAAKGGQLLYEPVPFSLLRGMGFGVEGDSWYCWSGRWFTLHPGRFASEIST